MSEPREIIAKIEHEQWESWAKSILLTEKISAERKQRWTECFVPYHKLSEDMKEHDRKWANKVLEAIKFDKLQQERDQLRADAEMLAEALEKTIKENTIMLNEQKCARDAHDWEPDTSMTIMRCDRCGLGMNTNDSRRALADFRKRWQKEGE